MKVMLIVDSFPPDISSAAHYFHELGHALVERGYHVTVLTRVPLSWVQTKDQKLDGKFIFKERLKNMQIFRTSVFSGKRNNVAIRGLAQIQQVILYVWAGVISGKQDIILIYSPRFLSGLAAYIIARTKHIPFIVNAQDIFPQSLIDLGKLKNPFLIHLAEAIQSFIHNRARFITVHSEGNRQVLVTKGVVPEKVLLIPNWVDIESIKPGERMNDFRREHGLRDRFVVSFAGRMDYSQGVGIIIEAAAILQGHPEILFLLVGDGLEEGAAKNRAAELKLSNVKFLPFQSKEKYPDVLQATDIGLVTLSKQVVTPVVPSKLLSIMSAGRPVLASLFLGGDAPKIIQAARCGICVEPGNPTEFAQAVLYLHQNPDLRRELGQNGRKFVERHYSMESCIKKYEDLLLATILRKGSVTPRNPGEV